MFYSFIVPAFNRPDEIRELLQSMTALTLPNASQQFEGFEIIIADGSPTDILISVIGQFNSRLSINHLHRPKLAISPSRNLGAQHARGDYLIFLDSDVILPAEYLLAVHSALMQESIDAFGGPDAAHASFTTIQKAISYAMTSYLTTGGIRGRKKQIHQYNPRGFNMGIRKAVFEQLQGYSSFTCGEDIELSIRIIKSGFRVKLIPEAYVYHKRRTNFRSFFRQIYRFGAARVNIFFRHRSELKITHMFPAFFVGFLVVGVLSVLVSMLAFKLFLLMMAVYLGAIFLDSLIQNKNLAVAALSVIASMLQLCGYGIGFIANWFAVFIRRRQEGLALGPSK